jgi:hypothetical protein
MTPVDIEAALARAEASLSERGTLKGTGFWKAVDALRRDRALAERYGDRAADIDRRAFERGVKLRVPVAVGIFGLLAMTAVGIAAVVFARDHAPSGPAPVVFLFGFGALLVGTHSLAHWLVGLALGMRFTHVFLGGPPPPRPGVKTDYATYLRATPMQRAVMHASGAVLTKIVPFALIPFVPRSAAWLVWVLLGVGLAQIMTDVLLSTKVSDWKKVKRELRARAR